MLLLSLSQAPCTQWQHPNGVHPVGLSHSMLQHGMLLLLHHEQLLLMLHVDSCCMLTLHGVHSCSLVHMGRAHESLRHGHRSSICRALHDAN